MIQWLRANPKGTEDFTLIDHDFFYDWPQSCVGASVYNIRLCLHNWGDEDCKRILLRLSKAMTNSSRLYIVEVVRPSGGDDLSNMTTAMHFAMVGMGGKLRTFREWVQLLSMVDLHIDEVRYANRNHGWAVMHVSKVHTVGTPTISFS